MSGKTKLLEEAMQQARELLAEDQDAAAETLRAYRELGSAPRPQHRTGRGGETHLRAASIRRDAARDR